MKERDRAIRQIEEVFLEDRGYSASSVDRAGQILNIPELAILSDCQHLPVRFLHPDDKPNTSYGQAQQDMVKANFKRVI